MRCRAAGLRERSFAYGTIKLFLAAIADSEAWKRELSSVDPRLDPGFGAYQLSLPQSQQTPLVLFLLGCMLGPLVSVLLFNLSIAGAFMYYPEVLSAGLRDVLSQRLVMSYCLAMVGALGLSLLTGVGAAAGSVLVSGLLSFVLMISRQWLPIRARYVGAGQCASGPGVEPGG